MSASFFLIKEQYFAERVHFEKTLDRGEFKKQARRIFVCLKIKTNGNIFYLPLRTRLGCAIRKYGRIGHAVPSVARPDAGIDYRYALVINDDSYVQELTTPNIPNSQYKLIVNNYTQIESEFSVYLAGYIKAANKNRIKFAPLYRESSLINFHKELGIHTLEKALV